MKIARKPTPPGGAKDMNVEVDASIRKRLRVYVAQQDVKIKAVVNAALDEYLKKRGA